jgi:hypothetical protein
MCDFVEEGGEEGVVVAGEVGAEGVDDKVGEGKGRYVVEHGTCVALGPY